MSNERSGFSSRIGFVLATAGSAVGLGNIWRFPYLAAKYGGGSFLLVYLILTVTFGFTLMITEVALGRKSGTSAINAFGYFNKKYRYKHIGNYCINITNNGSLLQQNCNWQGNTKSRRIPA